MPRQSTKERRSAAEWSVLLEEWSRTGKSKDVFARERSLVASTFRRWATELGGRAAGRSARTDERRPAAKATAFLPVRVTQDGGEAVFARTAVPLSQASRVELELSDVGVVRVPVGADVTWVAQLIAVVRGDARC